MKLWKRVTRWLRVLQAVAALITVVGNATEDANVTPEERARIWKAVWVVIDTYRGRD
jgi:hypothetical protein